MCFTQLPCLVFSCWTSAKGFNKYSQITTSALQIWMGLRGWLARGKVSQMWGIRPGKVDRVDNRCACEIPLTGPRSESLTHVCCCFRCSSTSWTVLMGELQISCQWYCGSPGIPVSSVSLTSYWCFSSTPPQHSLSHPQYSCKLFVSHILPVSRISKQVSINEYAANIGLQLNELAFWR